MNKLQDKIRGSLVGGAIGDAFGYPVEFVNSFEEICAKYGDNGINEYDLSYPWLDEKCDKALFSDDTQMSLYTAEGLLESERSGNPIIPTICKSYLEWLGPQVGKEIIIDYKSKLSEIEELNQQRAPGNTCITSLLTIYSGKEPINDSKGCGGVMRVAPIGLYGASHDWNLEKTAHVAGEAAELTHRHPLSTFSSAALAVICQLCATSEKVSADSFKQYLEQTITILVRVYGDDVPYMEDFKRIIRKAMLFENNLLRDWEVIEKKLGGGWVAEETLAIAIFSVLRHIDDFNACMICAINHGGDSDSTGAVAGNIIGAILGYNAIPCKLSKSIQLKELLLATADALQKNEMTKPIRNSYCVITDKVYAGEYAGDLHNPGAKIHQLEEFGITHIIDLTEEGELTPYEHLLNANVEHHRFPIKDVSVPNSYQSVFEIIENIDAIISDNNNKVYIHCWGGIGRTGTIVACLYEYYGEKFEEAINHLRQRFKDCPKSQWRETPETNEQLDFARGFGDFLTMKDRSLVSIKKRNKFLYLISKWLKNFKLTNFNTHQN